MLSAFQELLKKTTSSCWERVRVRHPVQFSLFPVLPLKNAVLNSLFRETFSIALISSKWWWFIVTASLAMFRYLKIAHHTGVMNAKDYQTNPILNHSITYLTGVQNACVVFSEGITPISILAPSSYLLCYEFVFFLFFFSRRKLPCSRWP